MSPSGGPARQNGVQARGEPTLGQVKLLKIGTCIAINLNMKIKFLVSQKYQLIFFCVDLKHLGKTCNRKY